MNRAHDGVVPLRACPVADAEAVRASFVRGQEDMISDLGNRHQFRIAIASIHNPLYSTAPICETFS